MAFCKLSKMGNEDCLAQQRLPAWYYPCRPCNTFYYLCAVPCPAARGAVESSGEFDRSSFPPWPKTARAGFVDVFTAESALFTSIPTPVKATTRGITLLFATWAESAWEWVRSGIFLFGFVHDRQTYALFRSEQPGLQYQSCQKSH